MWTSPCTMVYGRFPSNSLKILVENWTENDHPHFNLDKLTTEYLTELQRSLKSGSLYTICRYAQRYVDLYDHVISNSK